MRKRKPKLVTFEEAMLVLKVSRGTFYKRLAVAEARGEDVAPSYAVSPRTGRPCKALRPDQVELLRAGKNGRGNG